MLQRALSPVFKAIERAYHRRGLCRSLLTTLSHEIGNLPEIRRMVCEFNDRKVYPTRPMITLRTDHPSVYLLGWREGECTEVHDHGACEVAVHVIHGVVTEDMYWASRKLPSTPTRQCYGVMSRDLAQGQMMTCPKPYIHKICNIYPETAATLHVYGPVLQEMCLYDVRASGYELFRRECWHNEYKAQH